MKYFLFLFVFLNNAFAQEMETGKQSWEEVLGKFKEYEEKIIYYEKEEEERQKLLLSLPKRCSLESPVDEFKGLRMKLGQLIDLLNQDQCKSVGSQYINEMRNILNSWQNFAVFTTQINQPTEEDNTTNNLLNFMRPNVPTVMANLGNLAQKVSCDFAFKDADGVEIFRDFISHLSSVGLMVPGVPGTAALIGGQALAGLINIIKQLLTPRYDWRLEKDRNTFVTLNCGFFEIQNQIDKEGFYLVKTNETERIVSNLSEQIKEVEKNYKLFNEAINYRNFYNETHKKEEIKKLIIMSYGEETYYLSSALTKAKYFVEVLGSKATNLEERGKVLEGLHQAHQDFFKYIDNSKLSTYGEYLKKSSKENFKNIFAITLEDEQELVNTNDDIGKILGNIRLYEKFLKEYLKPVVNILEDLEIRITKLLKKNNLHEDKDLEKIKDLKSRYFTILKVLKSRKYKFENASDVGAPLDPNDPGSLNRVDLKMKADQVESIIYGKDGASFLDFIIKESKKYIRKYKYLFKDVEGKLSSVPTDRLELRKLCSDTLNLSRIYTGADNLIHTGFDFLAINERQFLQSPVVERRDRFRVETLFKKRLHKNFILAKEAKKWIKENMNQIRYDSEFEIPKQFGGETFAYSMISRVQLYSSRLKVENFNVKFCQRF